MADWFFNQTYGLNSPWTTLIWVPMIGLPGVITLKIHVLSSTLYNLLEIFSKALDVHNLCAQLKMC